MDEMIEMDLEAILACMGDDAATLRNENPEDEIADTLDLAAKLLEAAAEQAAEVTRLDALVAEFKTDVQRYRYLTANYAPELLAHFRGHNETPYVAAIEVIDAAIDAAMVAGRAVG